METAMVPAPGWVRLLGLATLAGGEFGLVGPFGSYLANPFTRVAYWLALFWVGALMMPPTAAAGERLAARHRLPIALGVGAATMAACGPLALLAALGCYCFWPVHASGVHVAEWYGSAALVALPAMFGWRWLERRPDARVAAPVRSGVSPVDLSAPAAEPARAVTIPEPALALACCLEMEDHHVRVHLPHGSTLHLATLRDAMAAVAPERGTQVHRSWWVARDAVRGWDQDGRATVLLLFNGLRVPVARQRVAHLRAAGWLTGAPGG